MRRLRRRGLTDEERTTVERLAHSRTAPVRQVERARIVWPASQGRIREHCADRRRLGAATLALWVEERNRVARLLYRPEFTGAEILVRGEDD